MMWERNMQFMERLYIRPPQSALVTSKRVFLDLFFFESLRYILSPLVLSWPLPKPLSSAIMATQAKPEDGFPQKLLPGNVLTLAFLV
jgi:hypothetical protein